MSAVAHDLLRECTARKKINWCPCIPLSIVDRIGENIIAGTCSGREIVGLLKKFDADMMT